MIGLERGLTDPITDLNMGQTAELVAHLFHISRRQADEYAAESQQRLARAQTGRLASRTRSSRPSRATARCSTTTTACGRTARADSLAKLKPAFERPWGKVTPGNSSQITDGASWVILASEDAVKKHNLQPKAVIVDSEWSALDPSDHGSRPGLLLDRADEAASACARRHRAVGVERSLRRAGAGLPRGLGGRGILPRRARPRRRRPAASPRDRLNVDGGAIGAGHPVGASGNRIVLHLVNAMKRLGLKRGIATECIGGGQGGAMLIEAI